MCSAITGAAASHGSSKDDNRARGVMRMSLGEPVTLSGRWTAVDQTARLWPYCVGNWLSMPNRAKIGPQTADLGAFLPELSPGHASGPFPAGCGYPSFESRKAGKPMISPLDWPGAIGVAH